MSGVCSGSICCFQDCGPCGTCSGGGTTCTSAGAGTACGTGMACDDHGDCLGVLGQTCTTSNQCLSRFCAPAIQGGLVCCQTACAGTCQQCDGTTGSCGDAPKGFRDTQCTNATENGAALGSTCGGNSTNCRCNGAGDCRVITGDACFYPWECLNGFCPMGGGVCP